MSNWRDPNEGDLGPQEISKKSKSDNQMSSWNNPDERGLEIREASKQLKTKMVASSAPTGLSLWQVSWLLINSVSLVLVTFFLTSEISSVRNQGDLTQRQVFRLQNPSVNRAIALSPDGKTMTISDEAGWMGIWSMDRKLVGRLDGHKDEVTRIIYSQDGKVLFTGSLDKTVALWDLSSSKLLVKFSLPSEVLDLAISPDNRTLLAMTNKEIFRWDITTQKQLDPPFAIPSLNP